MSNVSIRLGVELVDGEGDGHLRAIVVRDRSKGTVERIATAGLFVMIGAEPRTEWLDGTVDRDEQGFILTGNDLILNPDRARSWPLERAPMLLETSVPGVFAAGDVRHASVKRVTTAMGEGATAVQLIHQHLQGERVPKTVSAPSDGLSAMAAPRRRLQNRVGKAAVGRVEVDAGRHELVDALK
jgi:thioredoxin reductase (NADPH)